MSCRASYNKVGARMAGDAGAPVSAVAREGKPYGWPDRMILREGEDGVTVTDQWWMSEEAAWQQAASQSSDSSVVISRAGGRLVVRTPFKNETFVAALKETVPWDDGQGREWDGASQCWRIDPRYEADVRTLVSQHFDSPVDRTPRRASMRDAAGEGGLQVLTAQPSEERSREVPADQWKPDCMLEWCERNGYFVHKFEGGARVFWCEKPKGWPDRIDFAEITDRAMVTPMWSREGRDIAKQGGTETEAPIEQMLTWCEENGYEVRRYPGGGRAFWKKKWPLRRISRIQEMRDRRNRRISSYLTGGKSLPPELSTQVDFRYDM